MSRKRVDKLEVQAGPASPAFTRFLGFRRKLEIGDQPRAPEASEMDREIERQLKELEERGRLRGQVGAAKHHASASHEDALRRQAEDDERREHLRAARNAIRARVAWHLSSAALKAGFGILGVIAAFRARSLSIPWMGLGLCFQILAWAAARALNRRINEARREFLEATSSQVPYDSERIARAYSRLQWVAFLRHPLELAGLALWLTVAIGALFSAPLRSFPSVLGFAACVAVFIQILRFLYRWLYSSSPTS